MAKHLSLPKTGFIHQVEQSILRIFTPLSPKSANVNFLAPAQADVPANTGNNYHAEAPADQPKQRIKKENTFSVAENSTQLSPESKPKPEYSELKPEINLMHTGFSVAINFANNFKLPAKIYSRRGFETEFKFLALDTFSPYMDNRPKLDSNMEEEREYKVVFMDEDKEVGKMSEIASLKI